MSRLGRPARAAWLLLALLLLLCPPPPVAAHPFHLQVSNETITGAEPVEFDRWIAQSFVVPTTFVISRISLYVGDVGVSDVLTASIRPDASGLPSTSVLTSGGADGSAAPGWLDVDLDPTVELAAGLRHWIVARSTAAGGEGYQWSSSGTDAAYANGTGARSDDGATWSLRGQDFAFRVYGYPRPAFGLVVSSTEARVPAGNLITFGIRFVNGGSGSAASVWVNASLPPELEYISDDAANVGGVRSAPTIYSFGVVAPGTYVFNLTARARPDAADGTVASTTFILNATDHIGEPLTPETRVSLVTITGPATGGPLDMWPWLLLAVGVLGAITVFALKRRTNPSVEDVFVIDRTGLLLAHRSSTVVPYQDEDLVVGMLKVIQNYIRDAFGKGTDEEMRAVDFGDRKILIERGPRHSIAVVYRGSDGGRLANRIRELSKEIEKRFGSVLETWDGNMDSVRDITLLLPSVWAGRRGRPSSP